MPTMTERKQPNFELDGHVKRIEMRETIFGKTKNETTEKQKGGITEFFFFRWVGLYFSTLVNAERIHTKEKKDVYELQRSLTEKKKKKMKYKQPKTTIRECKAYHKSDKKNTNGSRNLFDGFKGNNNAKSLNSQSFLRVCRRGARTHLVSCPHTSLNTSCSGATTTATKKRKRSRRREKTRKREIDKKKTDHLQNVVHAVSLLD